MQIDFLNYTQVHPKNKENIMIPSISNQIFHKNNLVKNAADSARRNLQKITAKNNEQVFLSGEALKNYAIVSFSGGAFATKDWMDEKVESIFKEFKPNIKPDKYQMQAAKAIMDDTTVIVSAPTGTGKTLIGEFALYRNLQENKRSFYTTPLKALTNQKYSDFQKLYGAKNVGIMTGDVKINTNAPIIVMTTEIYRNMLSPSFNFQSDKQLEGVKTVVLDEFHYMGDKDRGNVWEEAIIATPKDIQLVALSATVDNSEKLKNWIEKIHEDRDVELIKVPSKERHVPLKYFKISENGIETLYETKVNLKGLSTSNIGERAEQVLTEVAERLSDNKNPTAKDGIKELENLFGHKKNGTVYTAQMGKVLFETGAFSKQDAERISLILSNCTTKETFKNNTIKKNSSKIKRSSEYEEKQALTNILHQINPDSKHKQLNGMPAIVFIFNRRKCEEYADFYVKNTIIDLEKRAKKNEKILEKINDFQARGEILGTNFDKNTQNRLLKGVGTHHAGLLPAHKALIEELFQEKLIDVVFATETLAAGINMPAKTTILTSLDKINDKQNNGVPSRDLTPNEFQQMAGRAGRRGIDAVGNVIVMTLNENQEVKAKYLATTSPDEIKSNFDLSYSDVAEQLIKNEEESFKECIDTHMDKSFLIHESKGAEQTKRTFIHKFLNIRNHLLKKGYIIQNNDGSYIPTIKALFMDSICGVNEIHLTELVTSSAFKDLEAHELAAAIASLTNDKNEEIDELGLTEECNEIKSLELRHAMKEIISLGVDVNEKEKNIKSNRIIPVSIDLNLAKYTLRWLCSPSSNAETSWNSLARCLEENTNLYEGDFFKCLNKTKQILQQINHASKKIAKYSHNDEKQKEYNELAEKADLAIQLLDKPPLTNIM